MICSPPAGKAASGAIRAVLFDKDGTLLDYVRTWQPINREIAFFAARGNQVLADALLEIGGQDPMTGAVRPGSPLAAGTHDEVAAVFARHLGPATPPDLAASIARIFTEGGARHAVLADDTRSTLARLARAGLVLGVASNDTRDGIVASLGRHAGVLEHFEFLAGCDRLRCQARGRDGACLRSGHGRRSGVDRRRW